MKNKNATMWGLADVNILGNFLTAACRTTLNINIWVKQLWYH